MNQNYLFLFGILGYLTIDTVARESIIGGREAPDLLFKYMVSLFEIDYGHFCGGAIISMQHVISAAHCFLYNDRKFRSKPIFALMGTIDLMKLEKPGVNLQVVKVYLPKAFNPTSINTTGDIAVLELKEAIPIAHYVTLGIVKTERSKNLNHGGQKATIAGWGWNKIEWKNNRFTGYRADSLLRYATVDVFNQQQCRQEHPMLNISAEHLCAKIDQHEYKTSGVCFGDNGGPLVRNGYIIGILSKFSSNCVDRTNAAIYTRVSHYLPFIRNAKEDYVTRSMWVHQLA